MRLQSQSQSQAQHHHSQEGKVEVKVEVEVEFDSKDNDIDKGNERLAIPCRVDDASVVTGNRAIRRRGWRRVMC